MKNIRVLETSLYVADLDKSEEFYRDLFGWETLLSDDRMRALKVNGTSVLLLFKRGGTSLYFRDLDGHLIGLATPGIWEIIDSYAKLRFAKTTRVHATHLERVAFKLRRFFEQR